MYEKEKKKFCYRIEKWLIIKVSEPFIYLKALTLFVNFCNLPENLKML